MINVTACLIKLLAAECRSRDSFYFFIIFFLTHFGFGDLFNELILGGIDF